MCNKIAALIVEHATSGNKKEFIHSLIRHSRARFFRDGDEVITKWNSRRKTKKFEKVMMISLCHLGLGTGLNYS
jgi:hypothetical protein